MTLGDDFSEFIAGNDFAEELRFTSDSDFEDLNGFFDNKGSIINGVVLEYSRFVSMLSRVTKDWLVTRNERDYEVISKIQGEGNYCEYRLKDITNLSNRDIV